MLHPWNLLNLRVHNNIQYTSWSEQHRYYVFTSGYVTLRRYVKHYVTLALPLRLRIRYITLRSTYTLLYVTLSYGYVTYSSRYSCCNSIRYISRCIKFHFAELLSIVLTLNCITNEAGSWRGWGINGCQGRGTNKSSPKELRLDWRPWISKLPCVIKFLLPSCQLRLLCRG